MSVAEQAPRPVPYDPETVPSMMDFREKFESIPLVPDTIQATRDVFDAARTPIEEVIGDRPVVAEDHSVPGPEGAPDVVVTVLRPSEPVSGAAGIYSIHGGGMVTGNRFGTAAELVSTVAELGVVAVTVEYRLAPESRHPGPIEDCYAGLVWFADHADEFGVDPARILVMGASAGGGLAAALALLARDRGGPALLAQLLVCPMIDDRNDTVSARQYPSGGGWDQGMNRTGWWGLLGDAAGGGDVSPYAAPARAEDVSGLPPAYIEVGAAEVFRDEDVEYASRIWATGGQAELHVWAGGCHGFTGLCAGTRVADAALAARRSWLERTLEH